LMTTSRSRFSEAMTSSDELAHHMDVAIGNQHKAPGNTVSSSSGIHAQPSTEELEFSDSIEIGEAS
jgi:hypothetical protein